MPIADDNYTPEQKTAYKVFYFCLSIVVVGTVILISSLRYSESNVAKEIIGIILIILGASLCYFMCLQIRRSALGIPKTHDSASVDDQPDAPEQQEEMAYVIIDSSGKLVLHPANGNVRFNERPPYEPPLLIISSTMGEANGVTSNNVVSSSSDSVALPWPLSMNRRRQLAQSSSPVRVASGIGTHCLPTIHQTPRSLPPAPPPYSASGVSGSSSQSSTGSNEPISGSPPTYEDAIRSASTSRQ